LKGDYILEFVYTNIETYLGGNMFKKESEIVLFLFLMYKKSDYPYAVFKAFQSASDSGYWEKNRRGLSDLNYDNKVAGLLKLMWNRGILNLEIQSSERRVGRPRRDAPENQPSHRHYSIKDEIPGANTSDFPISVPLQFIRESAPGNEDIIRMIGGIKKFDFLSVLITFREQIHCIQSNYVDNPSEAGNEQNHPLVDKETVQRVFENMGKGDDLKEMKIILDLQKCISHLDNLIITNIYQERGLEYHPPAFSEPEYKIH